MALARRLAAAGSNPSRLEEITSPLALFADPPIIGRTLAKLLDMLDQKALGHPDEH